MIPPGPWHAETMESLAYVCGHCGHEVASQYGWQALPPEVLDPPVAQIYICHYCNRPTFFDPEGNSYPAPRFGAEVKDLPEHVERLYREARDCLGAGAHTGAVLCCRKLLMNIAVEKGAEPSKSFIQYVEFLDDNGYIVTGSKGWVDHIRTKGNEATHEIPPVSREDAERLIKFVEMLLMSVYEFPAEVPPPPKGGTPPASTK